MSFEVDGGTIMSTRFVFLALVAQYIGAAQPGAQPVEAKLASAVASYSLNAGTALEALVKVAGDFQLPLGIEWMKPPSPPAPYARSWQATTPREIVNDIVKAYPAYEAEVANGVVHVFPSALRNDPNDVLNTRLGSFEVNNERVAFASYRLERLVKPIMVPPDPARVTGGVAASILSGLGDQEVTFRLESATVRDVLDRLCVSAHRNIWIVAYPPVPAKTAAGFLKMVPLDSNVIVEDEGFCPNWVFLVWGRPLRAYY
jgi:hypothetical protein